VVTHAELLSAGVSAAGIKRRVQKGSLIRQHRGVYRVGHRAPSVEARYMAAVKACGEGAVLCGRAAGFLLGILKCSRPPPPEVITPTQRRVQGIETRRCRDMDPRERTIREGIPVTTVPRTLLDLAPVLSLNELARACHEAGVRYRTRPEHVEVLLRRHPTAPGSRKLRQVMLGEVRVTLSKLERAFLSLLRSENLPLPETNRPAGTRRVDCRWPEYRLTVELDSYRFHNSRHSWEQDRRREREARARGDELRRYTYGDVFEDRRAMLSELRQLLSARRRSGAPAAGRRARPR
jgi:very-short-patch-repair endonuclease